MKKVAFFNHQLCIRGSTVSLYNYAEANESLLNNESIIVYMTDPENLPNTNEEVLKKFNNRFLTRGFNNWNDLDEFLKNQSVDVVFKSCGGWNDGKISKYAKTCVQAIFDIYEPHGDVYSYLHEYMSQKMSNGLCPFVHAICDYLPDSNMNLREILKIPNDAKVFGRIGGRDTFSVPCAKEAIIHLVNTTNDIYFVFMGTDKFYEHPQIIFLPASHNYQDKSNFIDMCDAMIHARIDGEVFSLAISEFLWLDKPIITYDKILPTGQHGHFEILDNKAILYKDSITLVNICKNFNKNNYSRNTYKDIILNNGYIKTNVMKKFKEIYLD